MRRISFSMTTDAVLRREKTVTRRLGWWYLKVGDRLLAVDKLLTKSARKLGVIEVVSLRDEQLGEVTDADVALEGHPFGATTRAEFIEGFCAATKVTPRQIVNRIEFRYVNGEAA